MRFKLNEMLEVEIVEMLSGGSCIVNIDGDLIRVRFLLDSRPKTGDRLRVKVVAVNPLKFQTIRGSSIRFNVEV